MRETGSWPRTEDPNRENILEKCEVKLLHFDKDNKLEDADDAVRLEQGVNCVICLIQLSSSHKIKDEL